MKGSMREKRPGYWGLRVFEGADPLTGKKGYRTTTFRGTKRQAQSALAGMVTEVDGGVVEPRKCSVAELLAAWLEHIEHVGRPGRPSSVTAGWCASSQTGSTRCRWAGSRPRSSTTCTGSGRNRRAGSRRRSCGSTPRCGPLSPRPRTPSCSAFWVDADPALPTISAAVRWGWLERNPVARARSPSAEEPIPPNRVGPGLGRLPRIGRGGPPARPAPPPGVAAPRRRRGDHDGVRPARPPGHVDDPAHLQPPHARRRRPGAEIVRKAFAQPVKPEDPEPEGS